MLVGVAGGSIVGVAGTATNDGVTVGIGVLVAGVIAGVVGLSVGLEIRGVGEDAAMG